MDRDRIRRGFINVGSRQVHFRYAGRGPAVILFGQSPVSSQTLHRQILAFARNFTAIAIDTPGLGRSSPLNTAMPEIADQAIALAETLDAFGLSKVGLYGSHTGASICLEFARRYPTRTAIALLDGLPAYSDLERNLRLSTYFQPHPATWDGLHLMWLWYRYREQNVFWPWNIRGRGTRGQCDIPSPAHLHRGVVDILEVGAGYVPPYAAAFRYRAEEAIPHLSAPVVFLSYPDDSLPAALSHLPRLPACCRIESMPLDREAGVAREIALFKSVDSWGDVEGDICSAPRSTSTRGYVETHGGQLATRSYGGGAKRPLLVLPPMPGSVTQLFTLPELLSRDRRVIAIDMPGCGDSDGLPNVPADVDAVAEIIAGAVDEIIGDGFDIYAKDGASAVALSLVKRRPREISTVILDNPPALTPLERRDIAPRYADPIDISWDGSYLLKLWHATRDQELYWPWYDRTRNAIRDNDPDIDPDRLTVEVLSYLKNPDRYADTWRAVLDYPVAEELSASRHPVVVCGDANGRFRRQARQAAGDGFEDLPTSSLARAQSLLAMLDR